MKEVLIIGSGLAGLTCAIKLAESGIKCKLVSPYASERSQSVMAAGGINAAIGEDDSIELHINETYDGGCKIANLESIKELCGSAPEIIYWLESLGAVFTRTTENKIALRAFGGQSKNRTAYSGSSTGKQIMTALINEARKYEILGLIERKIYRYFHSGLIKNGICYGAILYNDLTMEIETELVDAVVVATGGQNALFGKTTGSTLCDGYAAAQLFIQGAKLKNLEFIQYHPTTIETAQKRMLISEAARGEGGRLYYLDGKERKYFMEDLYGPRGNLMPRDIVAKHIYDAPSQVYLDISFLGEKLINSRLSEVKDLCQKYLGINVIKESIPVYPSVHFFMGGLSVDNKHETNIKNLYAIGECASKYHGANRLGGNSLLAAIKSANIAAKAISELEKDNLFCDFNDYIETQKQLFKKVKESKSKFSAVYIRNEVAKIMDNCLGITRNETKILQGLEEIDFYISISNNLSFDYDISYYINYSLKPMLILAKAILLSALGRKETRGSHIREDFPNKSENYCKSSYISYINGEYNLTFEKE